MVAANTGGEFAAGVSAVHQKRTIHKSFLLDAFSGERINESGLPFGSE